MRIERTRDILDNARKFHRLIAETYRQQGEKTDQERMQMLLNYLALHEKHLEETLDEYGDLAAKRVLEHWFQNSPCDEKFAELKQLLARDNPTEDHIIDLALEIDGCMIDMYKFLAANTEDKDVRALFQDLVSLEENEERRMVRDAMWMQDV